MDGTEDKVLTIILLKSRTTSGEGKDIKLLYDSSLETLFDEPDNKEGEQNAAN